MQRPCDRLCDIVGADRLQSRAAAAEHRVDRKPAKQADDCGQERVVGCEHHCRADQRGVGKCAAHRQLAFAALADIKRTRAGVGADARDVDEPLESGRVRLRCDPCGGRDVHGMERLPSMLDVKANRVHGRVGASQRIGDGALVVNVAFDRLRPLVVASEQHATAIRMP